MGDRGTSGPGRRSPMTLEKSLSVVSLGRTPGPLGGFDECLDRKLLEQAPGRPESTASVWSGRSPEVEDVGAGQGLQTAVLLADGLTAQAAVELGLLHTLVEAHDVGAQLPLLPFAAVDALAQAVQLQLAQLRHGHGAGWGMRPGQPPSSCPRRCLSARGHRALRARGPVLAALPPG